MKLKIELIKALKNQSKITKKKTVKEMSEALEEVTSEDEENGSKLEAQGMDIFFRNDSYVPAAPEEYEGHYPGNQNNAISLPFSKKVIHGE